MTKKILWVVFAFLAIGVGLYPGLYFIIDRKFGLLQSKTPELLANVHRTSGKIYVICALLSAMAGFYIAMHATGGVIAIIGFALLAVMWFSTTLIAYMHIRILRQPIKLSHGSAGFLILSLPGS